MNIFPRPQCVRLEFIGHRILYIYILNACGKAERAKPHTNSLVSSNQLGAYASQHCLGAFGNHSGILRDDYNDLTVHPPNSRNMLEPLQFINRAFAFFYIQNTIVSTRQHQNSHKVLRDVRVSGMSCAHNCLPCAMAADLFTEAPIYSPS